MNEYIPSAADAPDGPRNNRDELGDIDARTAEFESGQGAAQYDGESVDSDPFSPLNAPKLQLVVSMRIYDVLMALLNETNGEVADNLHAIHSRGKVIGSLPFIDLSD